MISQEGFIKIVNCMTPEAVAHVLRRVHICQKVKMRISMITKEGYTNIVTFMTPLLKSCYILMTRINIQYINRYCIDVL